MDRLKVISKYARDKNVLDIGSVGQTNDYSLWPEYSTMGVKDLIGIDLEGSTNENKELFGEEVLIESGQIVTGNMETHRFDREFDLIVAGDVLEHVENQGLLLKNISDHLVDDGKLILTTPNAKWPTVFFTPNPTHTCWHDKYTLERILTMSNFKIVEFYFYRGNKKRYPFLKSILAFQQSMIAVCAKQ